VVEVELVPDTWIIAPLAPKEFVSRWGLNEHLDRAFPRNSEGKPFLTKLWIEAPMRRYCEQRGIGREVARKWWIVDDEGVPVNHVVVDGEPSVYSRVILAGEQTVECFEYLDAKHRIRFKALVPVESVKQWIEALVGAGKIGMMSRTQKGYGRFKVRVKVTDREVDVKADVRAKEGRGRKRG